MYKISDRTMALEEGDNIAFVRDRGGKIQIFIGNCEAMKSHDPNGSPHTYLEEEMVVLEVRKSHHEIPDSVADEGIQLTPELIAKGA